MIQSLSLCDHDSINRLISNVSPSITPAFYQARSQIGVDWPVPAVLPNRRLIPALWGIRPPWMDPEQLSSPLSTARVETIHDKTSYKYLIKRYRAIIPVNQVVIKVKNQMHQLSLPEQALGLAAIRQENVDGIVQVCLLTQANTLSTLPGNARLPLIIHQSALESWLSDDHPHTVQSFLEQPCPNGLIVTNPKTVK